MGCVYSEYCFLQFSRELKFQSNTLSKLPQRIVRFSCTFDICGAIVQQTSEHHTLQLLQNTKSKTDAKYSKFQIPESNMVRNGNLICQCFVNSLQSNTIILTKGLCCWIKHALKGQVITSGCTELAVSVRAIKPSSFLIWLWWKSVVSLANSNRHI